MDGISCSVCGKELDEECINTCFGCGRIMCDDDHDSQTGFCRNCSEKGMYPEC